MDENMRLLMNTNINNSPYQLIKYMEVYKAKCKTMMYQGRRTKRYMVPGTIECNKISELRSQLASKLLVED
jgi:hypothetical protein